MKIKIYDELEDNIIESAGELDIDTGKISNIVYVDYDHITLGTPAQKHNYEFTSGILELPNKDIEFAIKSSKRGEYLVNLDELAEIKSKLNSSQQKKQKPKN